MAYKITLIPGDGIGPEVTQATVRILEATGLKFEWEIFQAGAEAFEEGPERASGGAGPLADARGSVPGLSGDFAHLSSAGRIESQLWPRRI